MSLVTPLIAMLDAVSYFLARGVSLRMADGELGLHVVVGGELRMVQQLADVHQTAQCARSALPGHVWSGDFDGSQDAGHRQFDPGHVHGHVCRSTGARQCPLWPRH